MMSNDSNVDNNNNDGTASCRLISTNRCCNSTNKSATDLFSRKDPHLGEFTKQKKGSDTLSSSLDAAITTVSQSLYHLSKITSTNWYIFFQVSKNVKLIKNTNVGFESKRGVEESIFEFESSPDELEEVSSSSEKENKSEEQSFQQAKSASRLRILQKQVCVLPKNNCHFAKCLFMMVQNSVRGILKYPPGWRRRAISESSALVGYTAGSVSDDSAFFGTSLDSPDILFEFDDDDIEETDDDGQDKTKKSVTFSEKMETLFVFRPNSSILGRRMKNQKKAARKREKKWKDSQESLDINLPKVNFKDEIEATKHYISNQRLVVFVDFYDSGSEVCSSGCELTDCSSASASECSGDEGSGPSSVSAASETLTGYVNESKDGDAKECNKSKRKNRRNRNRKNKQTVRTALETGGYDSD